MAKLNKKRGGLGRGLNAILSDDSEKSTAMANKVAVNEIPIEQIEPNRFQPRQEFEPGALEELAQSIKLHGIIQPLTVRKMEANQYELVSGERRLRASKIAGLKAVPVYIRTANDEQMLEMALIENIQRENLNPIEIANSYQRMISDLGLKQEELGDKVGKKRTTVTNYLRLLKLPPSIQKAVKDQSISMGHARVLAGIENILTQEQIFGDIISKGLSVRQTEAMSREAGQKKSIPASKSKKPGSPHEIMLRDVEKQLEEKFGNKVALSQDEKSGKGNFRVQFNNKGDLNRILEILDII